MKKILFLLLFFITTNSSIYSKNNWSFLIYMEADSQLAPWVLKNLTDVISAKFDREFVDIFIQCHIVKDFAYRYKVSSNSLVYDSTVKLTSDNSKDLVDASEWAFKNTNYQHYGIILWNHGFGILDPNYMEHSLEEFNWEAEPDLDSFVCPDGLCPLKFDYGSKTLNVSSDNFHGLSHKGTLFREHNKTYLTNQGMVQAFRSIKQEILNNKKIDILGTDCCKMAMLEVGYQIKDSVNYFIGSQNCELQDGWNYNDFFSDFIKNLTPEEVCISIVDSYGQYYKEHTREEAYTLSAFGLNNIDLLVNNINKFVDVYKKCLEYNFEFFKNVIKNARSKSLAICQAPFYTGIDSFYTQLLLELDSSVSYYYRLRELRQILNTGKEIVKNIVVANVTGENKTEAKGISFYFPNNHIDSSYLETQFAKDTLWIEFLEQVTAV